jgi:hypothetical protein
VDPVVSAAQQNGHTTEQQNMPSQCRLPLGVVLMLCCSAVLPLGLSACTPATARPTTRFTADDFDAMTEAMAQSLLRSEALRERGANSEPWVVSIQKVLNLSSDVVPEREQWSIMAQLRGATPIRDLRAHKNVSFVLPAERVVALRESEDAPEFHDEGFAAERKPTHVMTATFRSATRAVEKARTDVYYTEFEILDLATHQPVWQDRFEFKRAAKGAVWD